MASVRNIGEELRDRPEIMASQCPQKLSSVKQEDGPLHNITDFAGNQLDATVS
mgnify:CR=1 FL=1